MAKSFKFMSRIRNQRTWIGHNRIEFNNNTYETDDQRIANALREKAGKKMPHGLKGLISEVPMSNPAPKDDAADKSKSETKSEPVKTTKK